MPGLFVWVFFYLNKRRRLDCLWIMVKMIANSTGSYKKVLGVLKSVIPFSIQKLLILQNAKIYFKMLHSFLF